MILRRITQHVRNQEWTAIVLDFLFASSQGHDTSPAPWTRLINLRQPGPRGKMQSSCHPGLRSCHPGLRSGISPSQRSRFEILKQVQDDNKGGFQTRSSLPRT